MDNLRGAIFMTLAMLGFAIEDMFIKLMSGAMAPWQIIASLGIGGALVCAVMTRLRGEAVFSRAFVTGPILLRNLGEMIGTMSFVTALSLAALSTASAILQATPLVVTLGAAVFFREPVGWRRWSAIGVGFLGVLLVIRPGMEGFDINLLFAVAAVFGLGLRDLVTRRITLEISSVQLSFLAFLALIPAAAVLSLFSPQPFVVPDLAVGALTVAAVVFGVVSYFAIVAAMRVGEVSFVTPFRYARILFSLIVGMVVFGERPDGVMLIGAAIIVASGIYTVLRERKLRVSA